MAKLLAEKGLFIWPAGVSGNFCTTLVVHGALTFAKLKIY